MLMGRVKIHDGP